MELAYGACGAAEAATKGLTGAGVECQTGVREKKGGGQCRLGWGQSCEADGTSGEAQGRRAR